ncbi:MAG: 3-hydroxyacyl-CoA dehydrogenase NAD-binding domain-containing protein [Pseudomonadota bacterium]
MKQDRLYKNWHVEKESDGSVWLYLDKANSSTNTLDENILNELDKLLDVCEKEQPKAIVIASAKKSGFIFGADIKSFTSFKAKEDVKKSVSRGHSICSRLERLSIPTIACVSGICLGGGLELILSCRYRIALDDDKTRFGLPEVLIGIHPGWGGSVRLPRLIGAIEAMKLILTGKTVVAKKAKKLGFIDEAVPQRQLKNAVNYYIKNQPKAHEPSFSQSITNKKFIRPLLAKQFYKQTRAKIKPEHYPAPFAVIENWKKYGVEAGALQIEANSMVKVAVEGPAENLIRLFLLQDRLKSAAKEVEFSPKHIHVIGAGVMGGDIAAWCALKGYKVTLQDLLPEVIAKAMQRAYKLFKKKLKRPRAIEKALDNLIPDLTGQGIKNADVIIEAVVEKLSVKQDLFKQIEQQAKTTALLATNTSSIPLDEINSVLKQPDRLVGIHYFNPVAKMQLVEVIRGKISNDKVVNQALKFVKDIGKLPLPVISSPGFLVNRALTPYLLESVELLKENVPAAVIDKTIVDFGIPIGPIELADTVGLDICLSVAENLTQHYPIKIPEKLRDLVNRGELGKKTGKGMYRYDKKGRAEKAAVKNYQAPADLLDRLLLRMLNECVACWREKVVTDADLLDIGMVFGTGFAPFTGGPMNYINHYGAKDLYEKLLALEKIYGDRFEPDNGWEILIKNDKRHNTTTKTTYAQSHDAPQ